MVLHLFRSTCAGNWLCHQHNLLETSPPPSSAHSRFSAIVSLHRYPYYGGED